jgi:hypothetical protein
MTSGMASADHFIAPLRGINILFSNAGVRVWYPVFVIAMMPFGQIRSADPHNIGLVGDQTAFRR